MLLKVSFNLNSTFSYKHQIVIYLSIIHNKYRFELASAGEKDVKSSI